MYYCLICINYALGKKNELETGHQNLRLTKVCSRTVSSRFFAIYLYICHKIEVQAVILRSWTGLYLNWFKSYDTNEKTLKNAKNHKSHTKHCTNKLFFTKLQKPRNRNICNLCHNFWTNKVLWKIIM
jgi:hypothetical protein